jgi:RNA polymerase sigma-70 factor (ECF subfamily)
MSDAELLRSIYPALRRFAAVVAAQRVDPDDLVQEALSRVLARGALRELDEPVAYVRRTMLNIVRNESRRQGREQAAIVRLVTTDHADGLVDLSVLDALSPASKAAVFLVDVEGFSIAEAAALIGTTNTAARARLSRARRFLRAQIAKEAGS